MGLLEVVLLIILILLIAGYFPGRSSYASGIPGGLVGLLVVILLVVLIFRLAGVAFAQPAVQDAGDQVRQQVTAYTPKLDPPSMLGIAAVVSLLTQMVKFGGLPDKWGLPVVFLFSALGVGLWGFSNEPEYSNALLWPYFAGWVNVAGFALGVFGFIRAVTPDQPTTMRRPPSGAAQGHVEKIV